MKDILEKLKKAHIEYELAGYSEENISAAAERDIEMIFKAAGSVKIRDLTAPFDKQSVADLVSVLTANESLRLTETEAVKLHRDFIHAFQTVKVTVADIPGEQAFERTVQMLSNAEGFRTSVVKSVTGHPLFSLLLSEILYRGISDFLKNATEASAIIPGAGALLKFGSNLFGQAVPVESIVKNFIKQNIERTVKQTEAYLLGALTPELLMQSGRQFYEEMKDTTIHDMLEAFTDDDVRGSVPAASALADQVAGSEVFDRLLIELMNAVLRVKEEETVAQLLGQKELLMPVLKPVVEDLIRSLRDNGILEQYVQYRIGSFYESPQARAVFE